ncbi:hypothetical protein Tco_0717511 [Tanacetum coccineum]
MTIPNELINDVIQGADYYDAYLEKVAKHQRYFAGEELSDPDSPAPKPAKPTKQTKPKAPKQTKPTEPKAATKKSKPAPAKPQEKKRKPVSEPSELVDEFIDEGVPAAKPRLEDTEEAILQKVLKESLTDAYPTQRGPLPPVVFRETDTGKLQPLPEVPGKGKEKRHTPIPSEPAGYEESSYLYAELGLSDSDTESDEEMPSVMIPEEPVSFTGTLSSLQHLTKDFSYGDQFIDDKPSKANNKKTTADTEAESMVSVTIQQDTSVIPPMMSPVIGPVPRPDSPNVHWPLPTTTTRTSTITTTLPLPPQPQQGPSDPIIIKRMGELEELIANLVEENQALESRLDKQGNRINKLETMDLPKMIRVQTVEFIDSQEIDRKINESVKEVGISSVKHAMRAPLRARFKDLPTEDFDIDKAQEETKKKSKQDSPKPPPGSPPSPPPPPPPPSGASGASAASAEYSAWTTTDTRSKPSITAIPDDIYMDNETTADEQAYSSGDEVGRDHIPTVNLRQSWWKPLTKDRPATPEPAWTIPSSDLPLPTNNWASALKTTYVPLPENLLLAQIGDIVTFMDWYCK